MTEKADTTADQGPIIDALPYVDTEYQLDGMKSRVAAMIAEEMKQMPPPTTQTVDERFPLPTNSFQSTRFVVSELQRIAMGEPMEPMDTQRYRLEAPTGKTLRDPSAWKLAVDNAHTQLENQSLRVLNLELCNRYGPASWRAAIESMQRDLDHLKKEHEELVTECEDVNRERRSEQSASAEEIRRLSAEWHAIVAKNVEIQLANARLIREIEAKGSDGQKRQKQ